MTAVWNVGFIYPSQLMADPLSNFAGNVVGLKAYVGWNVW